MEKVCSTFFENGLFDMKSFDIISDLRLFVNDLGIRKIIFDFSSLLDVSKSFLNRNIKV